MEVPRGPARMLSPAGLCSLLPLLRPAEDGARASAAWGAAAGAEQAQLTPPWSMGPGDGHSHSAEDGEATASACIMLGPPPRPMARQLAASCRDTCRVGTPAQGARRAVAPGAKHVSAVSATRFRQHATRCSARVTHAVLAHVRTLLRSNRYLGLAGCLACNNFRYMMCIPSFASGFFFLAARWKYRTFVRYRVRGRLAWPGADGPRPPSGAGPPVCHEV